MQGKIIKGIAGFYYVNVVESGIFECKAKGAFRKDGIKPLVGDDAVIEVLDEKEMTGNITEILPRKNALIRPAVANIDQALVVFAVTKPKPHYNLLDRFLVMMERKEIPVVLCFNKTDIASHPEIAELKEVYTGCGYPVIFTSAKEEENISELKSLLKGKTTSIAGPSGVGKSSLINALMNRKALARTSGQPGKTQTINYYHINEEMYLVDLPGYGFARASEEVKAKWGKLIEDYLHQSKMLHAVFLLIDIRHAPSNNDRIMYDWILRNGYQPIIIATKLDKIKRSQLQKQIKLIRETLEVEKDTIVIPFSAETKQGREEIWNLIDEIRSDAEESGE